MGDRLGAGTPVRAPWMARASNAVALAVPNPAGVERLRPAQQFGRVFLTASHQWPLGLAMSLQRRFELLQASASGGAWIVEDNDDGEFSFGGPLLPTWKACTRPDWPSR